MNEKKEKVENLIERFDKVLGKTPLSSRGKAVLESLEDLVRQVDVSESLLRRLKLLTQKVEAEGELNRKQEEKLLRELREAIVEELQALPERIPQKEFPREIKVSNFPKYPEPPKEVAIKEASWVGKLLGRLGKEIIGGFGTIVAKAVNRVHTVKIDGPTDPRDAIAVRLSDGNRFYKAVAGMVSAVGAAFPFATSGGRKREALVDTNGYLQTHRVNALVTEAYDYVSVSYPNATTETYTYKQGGASGTTVATITVTYTDSSKESVLTIEKS